MVECCEMLQACMPIGNGLTLITCRHPVAARNHFILFTFAWTLAQSLIASVLVFQAVSSKLVKPPAYGEQAGLTTAMDFDAPPPIWRSSSVTGSAVGVRHHVPRPVTSGGTAASGNDGLHRPTTST